LDESTWLTCADPKDMLEFLEKRATERKLRLWACTCCRRVWGWLKDERSRTGVEVAERFAEGLVATKDLQEAEVGVGKAHLEADDRYNETVDGDTYAEGEEAIAEGWELLVYLEAATAVQEALSSVAFDAARRASRGARTTLNWLGNTNHWKAVAAGAIPYVGLAPTSNDSGAAGNAAEADEAREQCRLLRCLFGNPFRPLVKRPCPAHLQGLASSCESAFPAVSPDYRILADALEELGEDQAAAHCREETHARGCHVIDWILGRE
jgi:hypothetical protein